MKHIIAVCLSSLALTAAAQTVADSVSRDYGRCVNYDGRQAHDNRLQAMLQVSF